MYMCEECERKSGAGQHVKVRYTNEGYVCEHLSAKDAYEHLQEMMR